MKAKYLAFILPYFAVWAGLFLFKSAWLALVCFHIVIAAALILLKPSLPLNVFIRPAKFTHLALSLFLCVVSGLALYLLRDIFQIADNLNLQLAELGLSGNVWFGFITYFTVVNPFFEEYFWRGVLGSSTKGFYFGDLLYAGYHVMVVWNKTHPFSILFMLAVLTSIGWYWRQLYHRDGSLLAPVLGHMAADLSILIAVYKMT